MFRDFFGNITPVCKNLLFLNIAMFIFILTGGNDETGYKMNNLLGMHYPASPEFRPFQIVTYMFAHGSPGHIIFNMFSLVMFGSLLERMWGGKRFLIFYLVTGLGALALHEAVNAIQIYNVTGELAPQLTRDGMTVYGAPDATWLNGPHGGKVVSAYFGSIVGASGAIYGLLVAFAMLFPNTELMLLFLPVPIKAKYFVPILLVMAVFMSQANFEKDNVAHYAHLGGALFGFILVKLWQRNRNNFY